MARVAGFEPAGDGVRIRCLTAWRYPNNNYSIDPFAKYVKCYLLTNKYCLLRVNFPNANPYLRCGFVDMQILQKLPFYK